MSKSAYQLNFGLEQVEQVLREIEQTAICRATPLISTKE
jgi:hypothetical protein